MTKKSKERELELFKFLFGLGENEKIFLQFLHKYPCFFVYKTKKGEKENK